MLPLRKIHRGHVKALLAKLADKGYSKDTVRLARATLSVLCGDAVDDQVIALNPVMQLTRRGRRTHAGAITKAERQRNITPLTYEQLATMLVTAARTLPQRDATLLLLHADAGLRPGEALAVQWEDFDATARTLSIGRAVSQGEVGPTKTHELRTVDVTPRLAAALVQLQADAEKDALLAGGDPCPWIFPSSADTPLDPSAVAKMFRAVLREAKLPRFRLYDLRHTFATHLLAQGAPITYVSAQLGHAKPTTTLAFYAHWIPSGDKRFIDRLEAIRSAAKVADGSKVVAAGDARDAEVRDSEWSRCSDLNRGPADYESAALPTELHRHRSHPTLLERRLPRSRPCRYDSPAAVISSMSP